MDNYDEEFLSDIEVDQLIQTEMEYRQNNGDTYPPDENLCKYCLNIDKQNHFCWDCDRGSKYIPITFPLYNIVLMLCSLNAGLDDAKENPDSDEIIIIKQQGMIEALKFVIQPFGTYHETLQYFSDDILGNEKDYSDPSEIEKALREKVFVQTTETRKEDDYRLEVGTIRCHQNACNHCKYKERFDSKFCWSCDRGTNFRNGIRSIDTISMMLMHINTSLGDNLSNGTTDENQTILSIGIAEGLKWVIKPYTTEEELIEKNGFEYISSEDVKLAIGCEDEEYNNLDEIDV